MKRITLVCVSVCALGGGLAPGLARAWESECRPGDQRQLSIEKSICESKDTCVEGIASARGTLYGEHTWITREALALVGLGDFATQRAIPAFYTDGQAIEVPGSGLIDTQTPALPGAMAAKVQLPVTLAELSQVPDVSYGLSDYIAGNEHCFAEFAARRSVADVQACHKYFTHLGPVNSTHFLPQAQNVYRLYHDLALDTAERCRALRDTFSGSSHPLKGWVSDNVIQGCELEALALEATGSHFIEDAWSSGHMWQRWGSPILGDCKDKQLEDVVVAALSGLVHGWRYVAAFTLKLWGVYVHDRLCLGGPLPGVDNERTEWTYPGSGVRHAAVGDDYLLACKTVTGGPEWSMAHGPELEFSRNRMLSCTGRGFLDVYRAGPQTRGTIAFPTDPRFDPLATPDSSACFGQRATNKSMHLALGASAIPSSRGILASSFIDAFQSGVGLVASNDPLRADLVLMSFKAAWRAREAPGETDVADLTGWGLGSMGAARRNSEQAHLITEGNVTYLEARKVGQWRGDRAATTSCTHDDDCHWASYCAQGADLDHTTRSCVQKEAAIMSAYRAAHLQSWCEQDTPITLLTAMRSCGLTGDRQSVACDACVDVVLPHLRNACDGVVFAPAATEIAAVPPDVSRGSLCDTVSGGADSAPVYGVYNSTSTDDALRAARDVCCRPGPDGKCQYEDPEPVPRPPPTYTTSGPWPNAAAGDYADNFGESASVSGALCGVAQNAARDHAYLIDHQSDPFAHLHRFTVTTSAVGTPDGASHVTAPDKLRLRLYESDCTTLLAEAEPKGTPATALELLWNPTWSHASATLCVRVTANDPTAWTGYTLKVEQVDPETEGMKPGCALGGACSKCGADSDPSYICDGVPEACAATGIAARCCPKTSYMCCGTCCTCLAPVAPSTVSEPFYSQCCASDAGTAQCADTGCGPCKQTFTCCHCVSGKAVTYPCCTFSSSCGSGC